MSNFSKEPTPIAISHVPKKYFLVSDIQSYPFIQRIT